MPYSSKSDAAKFEEALAKLPAAQTTGELNYLLTRIALKYVEAQGLRYAILNDVLGAFAGAQAEFYRRMAAPYESKKAELNGDVYP